MLSMQPVQTSEDVRRSSTGLCRSSIVRPLSRDNVQHVFEHPALCSGEVGDCRAEGRALFNVKRIRGHQTDGLGDANPVLGWITSSHLDALKLWGFHKG